MSTSTTIWDDAAWRGLPPLEADIEADLCVVGLGGSGLACIAELLAMGRRVVGLDASWVSTPRASPPVLLVATAASCGRESRHFITTPFAHSAGRASRG